MAKLFVSYSRKDTDAAKKIVEALQGLNHDIWVDWEDISPAADWMDRILRGIEGVDAFIFLTSPDSIKSEVCKVEVTHAAKNNKRIIPVVVRQVNPNDAIDIIRNLNFIFLRAEDKFKDGIDKIQTAIELDIAWLEEHSRLQSRALEWHRKKENSLLLRGRDLREARSAIAKSEAEKKDPQPSQLQKTYADHSARNERRNLVITAIASIAILALATLSYIAVYQWNRASRNAEEALKNQKVAEGYAAQADANAREAQANERKAQANAKKAVRERQAADKARKRAEESKDLASAQRSAARAQIYQFRPGELYTSSLLAIASWQIAPSDEAEEILRENVSLLPIPVRQMTHVGKINSIEFNAQGNIFASAGADGAVCAWQVSDGKNLFCREGSGSMNDAAFHPKQNILVAGDSDGGVLIINADNGEVENKIEFSAPVQDVAFRPDGAFFAVTRADGKITLVDMRTRAKAGIDLEAQGRADFAAFNAKGTQIAIGSRDGVISIWDLTTNAEPFETRKHRGEITALAFSPNGRYIITGGADGAAVAIDLTTRKEVYRRQHNDQVKDIAFNKDGSWFVTASNDGSIRVWETDTGDQILGMAQNGFVNKVKVSANDLWLATAGGDNTVRVWSASTGAELFQIPIKGGGTALGFSADGKYLIAGNQNGYINVWDISAIPAPAQQLQFNGVTDSALYSPSGNWIAASDDKRAWLLNPKTLPTLTTRPSGSPFAELLSNIEEIVFSPKEKWIGFLAGNNIVVYNMQNRGGRTIPLDNPARGFAFSTDEKLLIVGASNGEIQNRDILTGRLNISKRLETGKQITALAAASALLAVGIEDEIRILDIDTFDELDRPESQGEHDLLAFSPDGSMLASGNSTGQIHIWKREGEKFILQKVLVKESASSLAFNPDNTLLAVGTTDHAFLINLSTFEEFARIPHAGSVNSVTFSPDGQTIMTSSLKTLQFWELAKIQEVRKERIVEIACQRLIENLSRDQWSALFDAEEFRPLCANLPTP